MPPVRITLPNGTAATSEQENLNQVLSNVLKRTVALTPRVSALPGP